MIRSIAGLCLILVMVGISPTLSMRIPTDGEVEIFFPETQEFLNAIPIDDTLNPELYITMGSELEKDSTIIYEYYSSLNIPIPKDVATALFYAIFSETQNLGREGSPADKKAYLDLLPQVSFGQLSKIQFPAISKEFISHLSETLLSTFYYKNLTGVILDQLPYPDFVAEMADFLLRIRNITWSICIGSYGNLIYISLRTSNVDANAAGVIKKVIPRYGTAGGHDMIAGARIKIDRRKKKDIDRIKRSIIKKMLRELNHSPVNNLFMLVTNEEFKL